MNIETKNLSVKYKNKKILNGINFRLQKGEKVFLLGPNGSGKSTFAKALLGLIDFEGEIYFKKKRLSSKKDFFSIYKHINYVFQNPNEQLFMPTVLDELLFGALNFGFSLKDAQKKVDYYLEYFDIKYLKNAYIHELSGGEKRIIAICSILIFEPDILILDEPTNDLDLKKIGKLFEFLRETNKGILFITHHNYALKTFKNWKKYYLFNGNLKEIK